MRGSGRGKVEEGMKTSRLMGWILALTHLVFSAAICTLAPAQTNSSDVSYSADTWHVAASPIFGLPKRTAPLDLVVERCKYQSFTDIFSNLKFGVMVLAEINRGPISLFTDAM